MTDVQLLEQTRLAIDALTTGGASMYKIAGREMIKIDLPVLWQSVAILERRIGRSTGGGAAGVTFAGPG